MRQLLKAYPKSATAEEGRRKLARTNSSHDHSKRKRDSSSSIQQYQVEPNQIGPDRHRNVLFPPNQLILPSEFVEAGALGDLLARLAARAIWSPVKACASATASFCL